MTNVEISNDPARLDLPMIHRFLTQTYWAEGRTIEQVQMTIDNSLPFGLYLDGNQIGFARVVTDRVAIAYVMDVFVLPEYRRQGYATMLMQYVLACPELGQVKTWYLKTRDARGLYEKLGFKSTDGDNRMMVRIAD